METHSHFLRLNEEGGAVEEIGHGGGDLAKLGNAPLLLQDPAPLRLWKVLCLDGVNGAIESSSSGRERGVEGAR